MSVPTFKSRRDEDHNARAREAARNARLPDEALAVEQGEGPSDAELKSVSDKAREIVELENANARLAEQIVKNTERLKVLQELELPAAMSSVGMDLAPLGNGYAAHREDRVSGHILKERKLPAYAYVRGLGATDLFTYGISLGFPRGCEALAKRVLAAIAKVPAVQVTVKKGKKWVGTKMKPEDANGAPIGIDESINYQTLNKWIRERKEQGLEIDPEFINVYEGPYAWVTRPKADASPTETGM